MPFDPVPVVTDDQIRQMAREAEAENLRLDPAHRRPRGWHYRRAAIRLGVMPLADMTVDELAWRFQEAMTRAGGV